MMQLQRIDLGSPLVTDGDIAVNNLQSARRPAWSRLLRMPDRLDIAEYIVELESFTAQFLGDLQSLDHLETLVAHLDRTDPESSRVDPESSKALLIHAKVASIAHRFAEAKGYLAKIAGCEESSKVAERLLLSIDQACGNNLGAVLATRRRMAAESGR